MLWLMCWLGQQRIEALLKAVSWMRNSTSYTLSSRKVYLRSPILTKLAHKFRAKRYPHLLLQYRWLDGTDMTRNEALQASHRGAQMHEL